MSLDSSITTTFLRHIFTNVSILKIGYTLRADVSALNSRLGNGSISLITPIIDIGILHRRLSHLHSPGVHLSSGGGLSGVIHTHLGAPLDKSQQCSNWGHRPLTQEQLRYASNDACCLLSLLCYFMHCAQDQLTTKTGNIKAHNGTSRKDNDDGLLAENALKLVQSSLRDWFDPGQLRNAIRLWGERWETSGTGGKIQRSGGLSHYTYADGSSKTSDPDISTFPIYVPWMDESRKITTSPLFLADVMLDGLARQLRLWGFDAEAMECVSKMERHAVQRVQRKMVFSCIYN